MNKKQLTPEIREAFRAVRKSKGYSYAEVAELAQVGHITVERIEHGGSVSYGMAEHIAQSAFGLESLEAMVAKAKELPEPVLTPEIREAFRAMRVHRGQTQEEVAGDAGVHRSAIQNFERGEAVTYAYAEKIVQDAWGIASLEELKELAKDMPRLPRKGRDTRELTSEIRGSFRAVRMQAKYTQDEAGELAGVDGTTITALETAAEYGKSISYNQAEHIARAVFGVQDLDALVHRAENLPHHRAEKITPEVILAFRKTAAIKGVASEDMAEASGVSEATIRNLLSGNVNRCTGETLQKIVHKTWGVRSLEELVLQAKELPEPVKEPLITPEMRDAFVAVLAALQLTGAGLAQQISVSPNLISHITSEKNHSFTVKNLEGIIAAAWEMNSVEGLLEAGRGFGSEYIDRARPVSAVTKAKTLLEDESVIKCGMPGEPIFSVGPEAEREYRWREPKSWREHLEIEEERTEDIEVDVAGYADREEKRRNDPDSGPRRPLKF